MAAVDMLENIFGSRERARLVRFFVQNPQQIFIFSEIVIKNMIKSSKNGS